MGAQPFRQRTHKIFPHILLLAKVDVHKSKMQSAHGVLYIA